MGFESNDGEEIIHIIVYMVPVEYKVPIKANLLFTVFIIVWATIAFGMAITIILSMIDSSRYETGLFIIVAVIFVLSFLAYNIALWKLKGQEMLQILPDGLLLKRGGNYFEDKQFIPYYEFDSIEYDDDEQTPRWMKYYNLGGGKIKVNYLGRTRRFGQSLSIAEAEKLSSEMNNKIKQIQVKP